MTPVLAQMRDAGQRRCSLKPCIPGSLLRGRWKSYEPNFSEAEDEDRTEVGIHHCDQAVKRLFFANSLLEKNDESFVGRAVCTFRGKSERSCSGAWRRTRCRAS